MNLKKPPGSKLIKIEWLNCEVAILLNLTQLKKMKRLNGIPDTVLAKSDWYDFNAKVITASYQNVRYFFLLIRTKNCKTVAHESTHLTEFILKHHDIKPEGEVFAYMVEHIFDKITKCLKIKDIK